MTRKAASGGEPVSGESPRCPWCSAALPSADEERCPSCGASLREEVADEVPGVTRVDHEALLRSRTPAPRSRGLIGWLSGEYQPEVARDAPGTLAPPPDDVRREMLRLELAALEAEAQAQRAELEAELVANGAIDAPAAAESTTSESAVADNSDRTVDTEAPKS